MHKLECFLENEWLKNSLGFWDTNGSPDPDQSKKNKTKRTYCIVDSAFPQRENQRKQKKKKKKKKRHVFRSCQRTEKAVEHEVGGDISCDWCTWNRPKGWEIG